jgi:hypothetical protein
MELECRLYRFHKGPPLIMSWASWIQSTTSHPITLRHILMLPSNLCLGFSSVFFCSDFSTEMLYAFLNFTVSATCPAHHILVDFITLIIFGKEHKFWSCSSCSFLHPFVIFFLLCPNIFLNTSVSNTLSLFSFLGSKLRVLHPYRTADKIIVLHSYSS